MAGSTFDDISTHAEREYGIAGSSLRVIDLETKEVLAERVGYMVDMAQGSRAGLLGAEAIVQVPHALAELVEQTN